MPSTSSSDKIPTSRPAPRKRKFRSEAEWRDLINRFEQSDLTQVAFCKQHGIATSGLNLWRKRLAETPTRSHAPSGFVPLGVLPESDTTVPAKSRGDCRWQMELEFAPGRTLKITLA